MGNGFKNTPQSKVQVGYFGASRIVELGLNPDDVAHGFDVNNLEQHNLEGPFRLLRGGLSGNGFYTIEIASIKFFVKAGRKSGSFTPVSKDAWSAIPTSNFDDNFHSHVITPYFYVQTHDMDFLLYQLLPENAIFPSEYGWQVGQVTQVVDALTKAFYANPSTKMRGQNGQSATLIHGDVTPSNIVFIDGEVKFIDISDMKYGKVDFELVCFLSYVFAYGDSVENENQALAKDLKAEILFVLGQKVSDPVAAIKEFINDEPNWGTAIGERFSVRQECLAQLGQFLSFCELSRCGSDQRTLVS